MFRASNRLADLLVQEERFWRQRAKTHWLRDGDGNTRYFHAMASARRKQNVVSKLTNEEGVVVTSQEGMCVLARNYFESLFREQ